MFGRSKPLDAWNIMQKWKSVKKAECTYELIEHAMLRVPLSRRFCRICVFVCKHCYNTNLLLLWLIVFVDFSFLFAHKEQIDLKSDWNGKKKIQILSILKETLRSFDRILIFHLSLVRNTDFHANDEKSRQQHCMEWLTDLIRID